MLSISLSSLDNARTMESVAILLFFGYVALQQKSTLRIFLAFSAVTAVLLHAQVLLFYGVDFQIGSVILVLLSYLFFAVFNVEDCKADDVPRFFVNLAVLSVPSSLVIALADYADLFRFEINTNYIFGFPRLTFLFSEPSHYAIFLALSFFIAYITQQARTIIAVLLGGLLLTLSLSGYFIAFFGLVYFSLIRLRGIVSFLRFACAALISFAILTRIMIRPLPIQKN